MTTSHDMSSFSLPPDKGTVQKVIVLPSNNSLHEDLILEELEVFKVSFSPASLSSHFFPKSKAGSGRGRAGLAWPQHKREDGRQTKQGGIQVMDVGSLQRGVMGNMLT